jgi:hypothetical protein
VCTFHLCLITRCSEACVKLCASFSLRDGVPQWYETNASCNNEIHKCHSCPVPCFICVMQYASFLSEWLRDWVDAESAFIVTGFPWLRQSLSRDCELHAVETTRKADPPIGSDCYEAVRMYLCFGRHRSVISCRWHLSNRFFKRFQNSCCDCSVKYCFHSNRPVMYTNRSVGR